MVTAGEGTSAPMASTAYGGGGGVGGKATRNQFRSRSRTTPYDRPSTAHRNPSLLSKLVLDPIRNLASSAANRFFASVTGKRLTPPPPLLSEGIQEVTDGLEDAAIKNNKDEAPEPLTVDGQNLATDDVGGISELERLLKQTTFTRSEIDRLTELLHSRAVVDLPVDPDVKRVEASLLNPMANFEKPLQIQNSPFAENGTQRERSHGVISTPGISARVLEDDVASPAELAKAYMGSRPSKVSPSMLGLRSQAIREEAEPFAPKSPIMSLAPRVTSRLELAENSSATASSLGRGRGRGRTAIYRMARSPYFGVPRTAFGKGSEPRRYGNGGYSLPSLSLLDQDGEPASTKLAQKRRSSVLDDDLGSVGPMRRIRQKHNLSSQRLNLPTTRGIGGASGVLKQPLSLTQKLPLTDDWNDKGLKMVGDNENNGAPSTSYYHVPPRSRELAAKIFQQLEKATPMEKSVESKLVTAREKSPTKLTTDMLQGRALRSLEDVKFPKLLQSTHGSQRLEDLSQSSLSRANAFDFGEPERIEENVPKTSVHCETSTPLVNCNSTALGKDLVPIADGSDPVAKLAAQRPQEKQGFMMSVHEDSPDLDEETYFTGHASEAVVGGRGKSEKSLINHSSASAEKVVEDETAALPVMKESRPESIFGKKIDFEVHNAAVFGGEKNGVAFPALQASSFSPSVTCPQTTSLLNKPKQESDKIPTAENSPVPSVPYLSSPKRSFGTQPTAESLSSSGMVVPTREVPASDTHDNNKAVEAADVKGKPENQHSNLSSPQSSTTVSFFVPENSKVKNGPLLTGPSSVLLTPAVASTGFSSQTLSSAGTSPFSISASVTNFASATSSSSPFGSSGTPIFQFGSPVNPSSAVSSPASTTSVAAPSSVAKTDTEREATTNNVSNTPFVGTSFAMASTGSSIFGLSYSSASSTKSVSDSTASGFMYGAQSSDAGSGAAPVSQNAPFQFGSSASSPVFGSSGVSSFMSSNPMISSSAPATKSFASGTSFGLSPSTSAETKLVDSGSGPSSGMFGFGTGASTAASGANAFSLSSGSSSTLSFGMSSLATSSLTCAVVSSSSTPPAIFSFGASSSSGTGMISSSTGTGSTIFGASTLSSSSETNATSSSSSASVLFGSSWQTPNSSPFGATSSSRPIFSMGASSSSFAATNTAPMVFGSATATSSGLGFSFTAASATTFSPSSPFTSASIFQNSTPTFTASGNDGQMSMEDSMAEDVQATAPAVPVFGQQPVAPSPGGFSFGSAVPPQSASPFQFGGQQSQGALQNSSPFQASGSTEFNAGGSFSLGSGGGPGDKSNRRIVRVNRTKNRKK